MKTFRIKKGKHSSGFHFGFTFKKIIAFEAMFDDTCLYGYGLDDPDRSDINKLFGISTTWFHHHQSSRIGWRCLDNKNIELLTYSYNKGKREEHNILGIVKPNEKFKCSIRDNEKNYEYKFKKEGDFIWKTSYNIKQPDWFLFHYFLYPYFGGNKKAPHTMKIKLEKIMLKDL